MLPLRRFHEEAALRESPGRKKPEMAGVNKVHFVVRNNTSVRGEITEGPSISSKNNYSPNTSSRSTPATARPQMAPSPGSLSDSSAGASVPSVQPGKRSQRRDRGTKPAFVAQRWQQLLQVSFSPAEFVNHLGRYSHFESIL